MRLLCAFAPSQATANSLKRLAPDADLVPVFDDDLGYARALAARWLGIEDLVVVEHDIELHDDVLTTFASCRDPWCVCPYRLSPDAPLLTRGLGCARFTAEAQRKVPFTEVMAQPQDGSWRHLDGQVAAAFATADIEVHVHQTLVLHRGY